MNPFNYEKLEIARLLRQKTQKDVVKDYWSCLMI